VDLEEIGLKVVD